jgi:hypothetical protein
MKSKKSTGFDAGSEKNREKNGVLFFVACGNGDFSV